MSKKKDERQFKIRQLLQEHPKIKISDLADYFQTSSETIRKDIIELIASIKKMAGIQEVSITTNGVLLEKMIDDLEQAGLDSINISLDTLKPAQYALMTRRNQFDIVMRGIQCAIKSSIPKVKLNCVLIKEINGDEILDLVELAHQTRVHVRFIELMPIGLCKEFNTDFRR